VSRTPDPARRAAHGAPPPARDVRTVVLLDRDAGRLADLTAALESAGIATLAAATTIASASDALDRTAPSAVVVDAGLTDGSTSPLDLVTRLRHRQPELKVVCLDDAGDRRAIGRLLAAGADAVFLRQSSPVELARAIRRLVRDDAVFVPVSGLAPVGRSRRRLSSPPLLGV
jgi:DNA-binding NarL/FixJ family response regulator